MHQLHDYQLVARDFLRGRDKALLLLDMGLGKTATALSALEPRHLPALVVAPKRVAEHVWPAEAALWRPDLKVALAAGDRYARLSALGSGADVVALGRDNLGDVRVPGHPFRTVIIDELSGYKSRGSQRWKTARKIVAPVPHVWGLAGTPAPNGLLDLWAQVYLVDGGARLGKTIGGYRDRYFAPGRRIANGTVVSWELRDGSDAHIHRLLEDIAISMSTEGRIALPPVTYNTVRVALPPAVRKVYRAFANDLLVDLRELFDGTVHSAANAAILTSKLSQITAGFLYENEDYRPADPTDPETDYFLANPGAYTTLHDEKLNAVREVVEGTGSPVLVFYRYAVERKMLQAALPDAVDVTDYRAIEAWNAGKIPVLLAHPASAGHGLNLQHGGHTVVWTTLPWSLEEWLQGNKRLIRQGQQHPVVIHSVLADSTVDQVIRARLDQKATVQDALLSHLESPV